MRMKNNTLIISILIILLLVAGWIFIIQKKTIQRPSTLPNPSSFTNDQVSTIPTQTELTLDVTANNGKFTPNQFTVSQLVTLNIRVNSIDADYTFKVKGYPRLDSTFKKGVVSTHSIENLGVGEYPYTCGNGCSGTIIVEQAGDDE